jgi:large subunit ribosomal protein L16
MLHPGRVKWRKAQKGKIKGKASRGTQLAFGSHGLKALENARITDRQIEACRIAMTRFMKREGKLWTRIFPDKPVTQKPLEVRMGKGKGDLSHWVAPVRQGRVLFEIDGLPEEDAFEALRLASNKLPIKTKYMVRRDLQEF